MSHLKELQRAAEVEEAEGLDGSLGGVLAALQAGADLVVHLLMDCLHT